MTVRRTWRVTRTGRVVCVLLASFYVGLAVSVLSIAGSVNDDDVRLDVSDGLLLDGVFLFLAIGHVWVSQRCRLILTDESVVVVNVVRTKVLPLPEAVEVTPRDAGLEIETRTRGTVRVFAAQTSNLSEWLRLDSRPTTSATRSGLAAPPAARPSAPDRAHKAPPEARRFDGRPFWRRR